MLSKIADNIYHMMRDYGAEPELCERMAAEAATSKASLIQVLRNHPSWDEENMRIHFKADFVRTSDINGAWDALSDMLDRTHRVCSWAIQSMEADAPVYFMSMAGLQTEEISWLPDPDRVEFLAKFGDKVLKLRMLGFISSVLYTEVNAFTEQNVSEESVTRITNRYETNWHSSFGDLEMPKLHLHAGAKSTRAVLKVLRQFGFDEILSGQDKTRILASYSAYADCMNPLSVNRHTVLSVNPLDFLRMSYGNSWDSCHYVADNGDVGDCGCYSAGGFSYALDHQSMIFYTVDTDVPDDQVEWVGKTTRQVVFWNGTLLQGSRVYPQKWDGDGPIYQQHREMVEQIMADCLGAPNVWRKTQQPYYHTKGMHYRDYTCHDYPAYELSYPPEGMSVTDYDFYIGSDSAFCLVCGDYLDESNYPVCSNCANENHSCCEECGERFSDDELYLVRDRHGDERWVCANCRDSYYTQSEYDGEFYPADECTHVRGFGWVWNEQLCEENGFYCCEDCGDWFHEDDMTYIEDWGYVCEYCRDHNGYIYCDECGDWFLERDCVTDEETGEVMCQDCYDDLVRKREALAQAEEFEDRHETVGENSLCEIYDLDENRITIEEREAA